MSSKILSIVIPAYNEEEYIASVIEHVVKVPVESLGFEKEVIVVDDGSKDDTYRIASGFPRVKTITQSNQGKGRAVQAGIAHCSGDYVLVQDADLEYEINDYLPMLQKLNEAPDSAIYGSRILGQIEMRGKLRLFPGKHPRQGVMP
ncbi:MAG: glycosyltransferase family 2 protein, partial [Methylococcales bacterium]